MVVRKGTPEWIAGYNSGSKRGINLNTIKLFLANNSKARRELRKFLKINLNKEAGK